MNRELDDVKDVVLNWSGSDVHLAKVGDHAIQCTVTRSIKSQTNDEDEAVEQCWEVLFTITDTDECLLYRGHAMAHKCQWPAFCLNTIGSYECECPIIDSSLDTSLWNYALADGRSTCSGKKSTQDCCTFDAQLDSGCRSKFRCPHDPCDESHGRHNCDEMAVCQRNEMPQSDPNYDCHCPEGMIGSGRKCALSDIKPEPKVREDGITPTNQTLAMNYCSCTVPIIDPCDGYDECLRKKNQICIVNKENKPECVCKDGYMDAGVDFGCVDSKPPLLTLRCDPDGDGITKLRQGDIYTECAIDVIDENAEDLMRSLKITYSEPLLHGCLRKVGNFSVTYTVATPWTNPPLASISRTVQVEDLNVCSLSSSQTKALCPELIPKCDEAAGATCVNVVGSYTCECPPFTSGDGFLPIPAIKNDSNGYFIGAPKNYTGGTGCVDTSKPKIELKGPNPKKIRICSCDSSLGVLTETRQNMERQTGSINGMYAKKSVQDHEQSLKALIKASKGIELCLSPEIYTTSRSPSNIVCATAFDVTYSGDVDLTDRIVVGDPIAVIDRENTWKVPYDVVDDAGNRAETVFRFIEIEELSFQEFEQRIYEEQEFEIQRRISTIQSELEEYRSSQALTVSRRHELETKTECPQCPDCSKVGCEPFDCDHICGDGSVNSSQECRNTKENLHSLFLQSLKEFIELIPSFAYSVACVAIFFMVIVILSRILHYFGSSRSRGVVIDENRERTMKDSITYYSPPPTRAVSRLGNSSSTQFGQRPSQVVYSERQENKNQDTAPSMYEDIYARGFKR